MPAETREQAFETFPVEKLLDNSVTDFDLFLKVSDHFILYGGLGYRWEREELDGLIRTGYSHFYLNRADRPKAEMYQRLSVLPQINQTLAPRERIRSIEDVGMAFTKCLYEGELTPACVKKGETIAESLVACVAEDPSCIKELSGLAEHDFYTYFHSVRVAAYAVAIAIKMGLTSVEHLEQLALGGVFHDIGKRLVPLDVLNKSGPLTPEEWQLMRSHPEEGLKNVSHTMLAHVPREVVLHHHEKLDGSGYPHGLDHASLIQEVQIVTVADVFDALTSCRAYQQKRSRYEALDFIKHKMLGNKLSTEAFKALIASLAT